MTTSPLSMDRFYAEMICTYMSNLPGSCADQMVDVQMALELSDMEFELGFKWCVERGLIDVSNNEEQRH